MATSSGAESILQQDSDVTIDNETFEATTDSWPQTTRERRPISSRAKGGNRVTVKAYIVRSNDYQWIKPYLFHLEAVEIAELMTVVSGKLHWIVNTQMEDMLNALVRFKGKELITDIWNISPVGDGFEADAILEGRLYKVQHLFPFEPWSVVQAHNVADDLRELQDQADFGSFGSGCEPAFPEIIGPAQQSLKSTEENAALLDPLPIRK